MNKKNISIFAISLFLIAACAPASQVEEAVPEVTAESSQVMEEQEAEAGEMEAEVESEQPIESDQVSFSKDVWPILEENALTAHGGKGGVFLESYEDIMNYVEPGDPENSLLYKALTADGMQQMPPSGALPDDMIQLFYDWIDQGAKNN